VDFKRLIAMAFTVGSLTIAGCPDDTPSSTGTEGSSGTGDDTTGGGSMTTITTTMPMTTASMDDDTTGTPTTTDPDTSGSSSDGGATGDCCAAHPSAGCENATCSYAVCAMNASCCAFEWSGDCVDLAERLCDGCGGGSDTAGSSSEGEGSSSSDDGGNMDQCCTPTPGTPGCPNQLLEECVCGQDSFCCDTEWDATCVGVGTNACGANCPVMEGDCCAAGNGPGCIDDECETAVCAVDGFCCGNTWDGICADAAAGICEICGAGDGDCCTANGMQGCNDDPCVYAICDNNGAAIDATCCTDAWDQSCADEAAVACEVCGGGAGTGDCCAANPTPGCEDETCNDAVCAVDPFCCGNSWDATCAAMAAGICGICGAAEGDCCAANGMQGCSDDQCVFELCGNDGMPVDDTCCTEAWDQACADQAANLCGVCGAVIPSNCCEANGGQGCDDVTCETAICEFDPYCCDTAWDGLCAGEGLGFCTICGGGMGNCCEDNGSPGCNDAECVYDICSNNGAPVDATCCTDTWDAMCATAAMTAGCVCNP
jgi:hypothetical protein